MLLKFGRTDFAGTAAVVGDSNVGRIVESEPIMKDEERVEIEVECENEEGEISEGKDTNEEDKGELFNEFNHEIILSDLLEDNQKVLKRSQMPRESPARARSMRNNFRPPPRKLDYLEKQKKDDTKRTEDKMDEVRTREADQREAKKRRMEDKEEKRERRRTDYRNTIRPHTHSERPLYDMLAMEDDHVPTWIQRDRGYYGESDRVVIPSQRNSILSNGEDKSRRKS